MQVLLKKFYKLTSDWLCRDAIKSFTEGSLGSTPGSCEKIRCQDNDSILNWLLEIHKWKLQYTYRCKNRCHKGLILQHLAYNSLITCTFLHRHLKSCMQQNYSNGSVDVSNIIINNWISLKIQNLKIFLVHYAT